MWHVLILNAKHPCVVGMSRFPLQLSKDKDKEHVEATGVHRVTGGVICNHSLQPQNTHTAMQLHWVIKAMAQG